MAARGASDFARRYGPWALVAGASDGLGRGVSPMRQRSRGLNVVLLARREGLLKDVASHVEGRHGVATKTIVADLTASDLGDVVALGLSRISKSDCSSTTPAPSTGAAKFLDRPPPRRPNAHQPQLPRSRDAGPPARTADEGTRDAAG